MRICSGIHGGRILQTPKNRDIRPTSDKIRQAIFNSLRAQGLIENAIVIDAFCGTGALGLEALSQGAKFCIFFDKHRSSLQLCEDNIAALGEEDRSKIILQDATKLKPNGFDKASLIFLDPPYKKDMIPQAITSLVENNLVADDALFILEMYSSETVNHEKIQIENEKIYGDTKIILGRYKTPE
ncbi:MAG: 16S rRNA (guanine(966)-N(2))-methyltransferase RsmD [Pseudomonadota bacterium]